MKAPTSAELTYLTHIIAQHVGRFLERQGLLKRDADDWMARIVPTILMHSRHPWRSDAGDGATHGAVAENSHLAGDAVEGGPLDQLLGRSTTYRIAVGSHAGRKVSTLRTLPDCNEPFDDQVGEVAGFSARMLASQPGRTNARS